MKRNVFVIQAVRDHPDSRVDLGAEIIDILCVRTARPSSKTKAKLLTAWKRKNEIMEIEDAWIRVEETRLY